MTTERTLIDHMVRAAREIEDALYLRARTGQRGFLEVPEPKVTLFDDALHIERAAPIWHTTMPAKTTHGGRATFYDLTDEATIAQALAAKESR